MEQNRNIANILRCLKDWEQDIVGDIRQIVELESPSGDKESLDRVGEWIHERFQTLGAQVEMLKNPDPSGSDHVLVKWQPHLEFGDDRAFDAQKRILLLGHFDTVHPKGSYQPVVRQDGDTLYGPGIFDMKSGIIMALYALRLIQQLNLPVTAEIWGLFTTDEEVGSATSRQYIQQIAQLCDAVLVLEPSAGDGMVKTSRKGVGDYEIIAYGTAAHAGLDHEKGINAIVELAHHIIKVQNLTDYSRGTTVSVGIVSGGSRSNVVPDEARAIVDVRVSTLDEAQRIDEAFRKIRPVLPGASVEVQGGINRPPMERTAGVAKLYQFACHVAHAMGTELREIAVGGGSDGNFTAGLGIPTLDGLGAVGDGAHTLQEHIRISATVERIGLLVGLLLEIANNTNRS
jgi:glutamate carboxypeptidase